MNIDLFIPTYKRSHIILSKTLMVLASVNYPQENIFIVVGIDSEKDYWDYYDVINPIYPNINILVGDNCDAKASQLNHIRNDILEDNQLAIIMDDDIEDILVRKDEKTLVPITQEQFENFLDIAPNLMREYKVGLCGVNSSGNPYYMSDCAKLCCSNICGGFQLFFNEQNINLKINQGTDAFESCYYLDKFKYNLKFDFMTIKTKLFAVGGLYDYRKDMKKTYTDYLTVAKTYPQYLNYYTWELGASEGVDNLGKTVKIPKSRRTKLNIELKWKRTRSIKLRKKEDVF